MATTEAESTRHPCGFKHHEGHPCSQVPIGGRIFKDVIASRRTTSDLLWATQSWTPSSGYGGEESKSLKPSAVADLVGRNPRICEAIAQESLARSVAIPEIELRTKNLLKEMCHNQEMMTVRFFAVVLSKLMRRIFCHVYVNREGIEKVREALPRAPTIFLPTHRSYADFLLISFLNYSYHLPLPVIAAAMDFTGMSGVGELLRRSGAFFIKRNIRDDPLYRAILVEYVQTIVKLGNQPLEFYIEGTRSRTAKSLAPKIGMLGACFELYLKGAVPDLNLVPITITYDRTMEEKLYAYELLGIPKPKESTSGLFKSLSVLSESHGNAYINVGDPISLRELLGECGLSDQRLVLRSLRLDALTEEEEAILEVAGLSIVRQHSRGSVVPIFALLAASLVGRSGSDVSETFTGVRVGDVIEDMTMLKRMIEGQGYKVSHGVTKESITHALAVHSNLVRCVTSEGSSPDFCRIKWDSLHSCVLKLKEVHPIGSGVPGDVRVRKGHDLKEEILHQAVPRIMVQLCVNACLHTLFRPFLLLIAWATHEDGTLSKESLSSQFAFLMSVFRFEFVHDASQVEKEFDETLEFLKRADLLRHSEGFVTVEGVGEGQMSTVLLLARSTMMPFLQGYAVVADVILGTAEPKFSSGTVMKKYQARLEELLLSRRTTEYSALILDIASNALRAFRELKGLRKVGVEEYGIDHDKMADIRKDLGRFLPVAMQTEAVPSSKL